MANQVMLCQRLWQDTVRYSTASLFHPFVIEIAQGIISKVKFKEYMSQDKFYLDKFNACITKSKSKYNKHDSTTIDLLDTLFKSISDEKNLHENVLNDEKRAEIIIKEAARNYTDHMLHVVNTETDIGYDAASFAPCPMLYQYIGNRISAESKFLNPDFDKDLSDWIKTYSNDGEDLSNGPNSKLLNRQGVGLSYKKLLHYYTQSMILEYQFFDAYQVDDRRCPSLIKRVKDGNITLILDFDKTLTTSNTCDIIGMAAIKATEKSSGKDKWNKLEEKYFEGYKKTMHEMIHSSSVEQCCQILNCFEVECEKMVCDTKLFSGMNERDLKTAANFVQLNVGAAELVEKSLQASNMAVKIISANWSSKFIKATLEKHVKPGVEDIEIISNNFTVDEAGITNGGLVGGIRGPKDKEDRIKSLNRSEDVVIYVGDSTHDLLALLAADIGIVIGKNAFLRKMCEKFGILLLPLVSYTINPKCREERNCRCLFYADSFFDMLYFIHGVEDKDFIFKRNMEDAIPRVLTIGGSDSCGCSGVQADIKTCEALGVYNMAAVTSVTAQNTEHVLNMDHVDSDLVYEQIFTTLDDIGADVVKIGMVPTSSIVDSIVDALKTFNVPQVVLDPVFASSTGTKLVDDAAMKRSISKLFPMASIVTPNVVEAAQILGCDVKTVDDMKEAARKIHQMGPSWVLLKGGHVSSFDGYKRDVLYDGVNDIFYDFRNPEVASRNNRGTGCTLASAVAGYLARGRTMYESVELAERYLQRVMKDSVGHLGNGPSGPLCHTNRPILKLKDLRLYFVTDREMISGRGLTIGDAVEEAIMGGATMVQVRCKETGADAFCTEVKEALKVCRKHNVPLIVNDRVDVAIVCEADGVHVGQTDVDVRDVRKMIGPNKIIGVSASCVEEAVIAQQNGADYIGAGAVFVTKTKPDADDEIGLDSLSDIVKATSIPVVAIGGINRRNLADVVKQGVAGAAIVSAILIGGSSVRENCKELRIVIEENVSEREEHVVVQRERIIVDNQVQFLIDIDELLKNITSLDIVEVCKEAILCGASVLQIVCRSLDGAMFIQHVNAIIGACRPENVAVIVNDRLDVALICDADGVHLESGDISIQDARKLLGSRKLIGATVTTFQEANKMEKLGVDYLLVKSDEVESLRRATAVPIIAEVSELSFLEDSTPVLPSGANGLLISSANMRGSSLMNLSSLKISLDD